MRYKALEVSDIPAVVRLTAEFHAESSYRDIPFLPKKLAHYLKGHVNHPTKFFMCAYDGDALVGFMGGHITSYFFSDSKMSCDSMWYVQKDYRGSRVGLKLLQMYQAWASEKGVREICVGVSSGIRSDKTGKFLERLGYRSAGEMYKL